MSKPRMFNVHEVGIDTKTFQTLSKPKASFVGAKNYSVVNTVISSFQNDQNSIQFYFSNLFAVFSKCECDL